MGSYAATPPRGRTGALRTRTLALVLALLGVMLSGACDGDDLVVDGEDVSTVSPIVFEDFSTYTSAANLLADPPNIWDNVEAKEPGQIALDTGVGYRASNRAMRYDFPNNGSSCADHQIRPGVLQIPSGKTHLWVEFVVRFSTNFRVDHGNSSCGGEYKLAAMGDLGDGVGRWNIPEMQDERWVLGWPSANVFSTNPSTLPSELWDGQPHVFRVEVRLGSGNGILRFWADGVLISERTNLTTHRSHSEINYFAPGLNLNQGPSINNMKIWWHKIAVYDQNPGW